MLKRFPSHHDIDAGATPPGTGTLSWSAPGTCGEFVQGRLCGVDFLVNSPIDRFSSVTLSETGDAGVRVADPALTKVATALAHIAERYGCCGLEVAVASELPHGKGMASSTADLIAAVGAVLDRAGVVLSVRDLAELLVGVEPSDCTHVPGIGIVGHLCGRVFASYPAPAGLRVLVVDCGGAVDTIAFDRARAHHVYDRSAATVRGALTLARRALRTGNAAELAWAATVSARLSQQILPKPPFADLLAIAEEGGALGVNCAHSGSVLGLLYRPAGDRGATLRRAVARAFGTDVAIVGDHRFISGGLYVRRH